MAIQSFSVSVGSVSPLYELENPFGSSLMEHQTGAALPSLVYPKIFAGNVSSQVNLGYFAAMAHINVGLLDQNFNPFRPHISK